MEIDVKSLIVSCLDKISYKTTLEILEEIQTNYPNLYRAFPPVITFWTTYFEELEEEGVIEIKQGKAVRFRLCLNENGLERFLVGFRPVCPTNIV